MYVLSIWTHTWLAEIYFYSCDLVGLMASTCLSFVESVIPNDAGMHFPYTPDMSYISANQCFYILFVLCSWCGSVRRFLKVVS